MRVIPGWFSIVPPLIAILLALFLRQVLVSLAAGVYIGALLIYNYNPLTAFLRLPDTIIVKTLINPDNIVVILFTLLFGGVIGLISKNGGTAGISNHVTKFANTPKSGMISTWVMGLIIFFDDYANTLIMGNMMRPITDKLRISREKLAYIVDSTSAPVASVFLISSWIGFEIGLIDAGLKTIGSTENAYNVLIQTLPYRFYPIAALIFVFFVSYFERDFGPMLRAEKRARIEGEIFSEGSEIGDAKTEEPLFYDGDNAKWYNGAVPIAIIVVGTVLGLLFTGIDSLQSRGINEYGIKEIISGADSFSALLWSSFFACIVAVIMSVSQKINNLAESISAWNKGVQSMVFACIILVFAWAIGNVTSDLNTADYILSILNDSIDARFLPVLVFLVCAMISFATGTSYGTMAIVMPIVIPLVYKMSEISTLSAADSSIVLVGVISSVLAGSVFGDHCSPISDTTILSSMASKCNHIDHVRTQMPYALTVGVVCMLLGDIPSAFGLNPFLSIILIAVTLLIILLVFGKRVQAGN